MTERATAADAPTRLRFVAGPPSAPPPAAELTVVLDTTWTPLVSARSPRVIGLREVAEEVLTRRDLGLETTAALDRWVEASGVVEALTHQGVSFWYGSRLRHWTWLHDQLLWLAVLDAVLVGHPGIREIAWDAGVDPGIPEAAALVAARDGLAIAAPAPEGGAPPAPPAAPGAPGRSSPAAGTPVGATASRRPTSILGRLRWRLFPPEAERRRRLVAGRIAAIEADPARRLLVVQAHAPQRVEGPDGARLINPFLGPVVERLRGTRLEPFEVDLRATMDDDTEAWSRLEAADRERTLPIDAARVAAPKERVAPAREEARRIGDLVRSGGAPLVVAGVDLGPALTRQVADRAVGGMTLRISEVARLRALIRRLHPAAILLADEYHRQDWLAAAGAEGVPVAAIQHGIIDARHLGYIHAGRPAELRLPARTYVFGAWERDLLVERSVYRPEEVVVGGSPRLDLVHARPADRAGVRAELEIADGDRLVVLSGTWGRMDRRFAYPIVLARLFAAPLERVHLVVKLHPSEDEQGPYRPVIDGVAAAGGYSPPPISTVKVIDLYRLLGAADAHLGIRSTVITEAVAAGTPNLLANALAGGDSLGYVDAGVAVPVRDPADLLAALDRPREEILREADRTAFLRAHFEPGEASRRIADDLLTWLP